MPSKKRAPKTKTAAAPGPADDLPSLDTLTLERQPSEFSRVYAQLLDGLPSSVIEKVKVHAEVRGFDTLAGGDDVRELLENACIAYERKKLASRLGASRRRAAKEVGAAAVAVLEAAPAALEAAPAVESLAPAPDTEPTPLP